MECLRDISARAIASTPPDYGMIKDAIMATQPVCAAYLDKIVAIAKLFCDSGETATQLFGFANRWGDCRKLGQEYMSAVADASFYGGVPHVNVRKALLATNLVAPNVVDGIGRLVFKGDVFKIAKMVPEAKSLENDCVFINLVVGELVSMGVLGAEAGIDMNFLYMIRVIAFHVGKGKLSFDGRDFGSVLEIRERYIMEVSKIDGVSQTLIKKIEDEWATTQSASVTVDANPVAGMDVDDPVRIVFEHGGFKKGSLVVEKKGNPADIYEVVDIGLNIELKEFKLVPGTSLLTVRVTASRLVEEWRVRSGAKPFSIAAIQNNEWSASKCFGMTVEACALFESLRLTETAFEAGYADKLTFCLNPRELRTNVKIKKGELKFAPFTDVSRLSLFSPTKDHERMGISRTKGSIVMKVGPPEFPSTIDTKQWNANKAALVPFWWVAPCATPAAANMTLEKHTANGATFFILMNVADIQQNSRLTVYISKPDVKTLTNVIDKKRSVVKPDAPAKRSRTAN